MQLRIRGFGLACVVVFMLATGMTHGQQRRGFFGRSAISVAAVSEVGQELKLTDKQMELAKKLAAEHNKQRQKLFEGFGDLSQDKRQERIREYGKQREKKEKQLAESVGQKKFERIQQLSLQVGGEIAAFFDQQITRKLEITDDQRTRARESLSGLGDEYRAARDDQKALTKLLAKANEKLAAVLTDAQKSKWKKLKGKPASEKLLSKIRAATSRRRRSTD